MAPPKVFISYSWSSAPHIEWVVGLATLLRENGADAHLDKWDLKEGHDAYAYMERMVSDPAVTKVVMICDEAYANKANKRAGGVGTEAQIISPELYKKTEQDKFVAIVREKDSEGNPFVPTFYGGRIHIDMSDEELFAENFEQLLRWIYGQPLYPKPTLGSAPRFLELQSGAVVGNPNKQRLAIRALQNGQTNAAIFVEDYLDTFIGSMENLRLTPAEATDEDVWQSIEDFLPAKNEISELFGILARTGFSEALDAMLVRFFERVGQLQHRPESVTRSRNWDWDNFKFAATELFLTASAKLIRYERFETLNALLSAQYYVRGGHGGQGEIRPFTSLNYGLEALEYRNKRLKLNRISLTADLLRKRCEGSGLELSELIQADLMLYFRETADSFLNNEQFTRPWRAHTLIFAGYDGATEKFLRATSRSYFKKMMPALGLESLDQFQEIVGAIKTRKVQLPPEDYGRPNVLELLNADNVATKP